LANLALQFQQMRPLILRVCWRGRRLVSGDVVPGGRGSPCTDYLTLADWLEEFDIDDSAVNKPFQTRRGYRGVSCRHVEKGDKVCISWGGELPFILRESGTLQIPDASGPKGEARTQGAVRRRIPRSYISCKVPKKVAGHHAQLFGNAQEQYNVVERRIALASMKSFRQRRPERTLNHT
jgi:hypothetical protein